MSTVFLNAPPMMLQQGERLELDREDCVWFVEAGRIEVYYSDRKPAPDSSTRTFLFEVGPGEMVPALRTTGSQLGVRFFATGSGARLRAVEAERFARWLATDRGKHGDALLASWLDRLGSRLETLPSAVIDVPLPVGKTVTLPSQGIARSLNGICWIELENGSCRLSGRQELNVRRREMVPLSRRLWLQPMSADTTVRTMSTLQVMSHLTVVQAFEETCQRLLATILSDDKRAAFSERERLQQSEDRDVQLLSRSFQLLGGIMNGGGRAAPVLEATPSPLIEACRIVGAELGLSIERPLDTDGERNVTIRDPVEAVARASKVRCRRVMLRGEWWNRDNGPLVAFTKEEGHPVALVQRGPTRYEICSPAAGTTEHVTAEVAATLSPAAYMFFPSFGHRTVTLLSLLQLGMKGLRGDLWLIVLLSGAASLLALVAPFLSQILFDDIVPQADRGQVPVIAVVLFGVAIVAATLGLVRGFVLLRVEAKTETNMEAAIMDRLLRLPAGFFRDFLAGDLAQRVMGIATIHSALTGTALIAILGGVFSVVSLGLVVYYDMKLALLAIGLAIVLVSIILVSNLLSLRYKRVVADRNGRISGLVLQLMSSISKLRTAAAERRAFGVWAMEFAEKRRQAFAGGAIHGNFQSFTAAYPILTSMLFFGMVYVVTEQTGAGQSAISTGAFIAVIVAFSQFLAGMLGLGSVVISVLDVVPQYERLKPIVEASPEINVERVDPGRLRGNIEVTNLTFRYTENGPIVLNDVSFQAHRGEMIALVGPSGSGKSTLIRLLLGFEQPDAGAILYDGKDLAGLDLDVVRHQCGVVLQHGHVVQGDLLTNIVGPWNLSLQDAWKAAEMVGLAEDIKSMPMGLHTLVSEDGGTFSGGQRQRLLIARAIVHGPAILLLDEATSALDNRTQQIVSASLKTLRVTRIVIAHRLSTIKEADRIYVMEAGRIVETGNYESLLEQGGQFAALAARQLL